MRMETRIVQDWRRNNRHSAVYDDRPTQPPPPGTPADIWSYGCLLAEVLTGRKLFQVWDLLNPHNIGENLILSLLRLETSSPLC